MTRDYEGLCERLDYVADQARLCDEEDLAECLHKAAVAIRDLVRQRDEAERETVERIVAWLRGREKLQSEWYAQAIERGEHMGDTQ